jgi:hypothetical protein
MAPSQEAVLRLKIFTRKLVGQPSNIWLSAHEIMGERSTTDMKPDSAFLPNACWSEVPEAAQIRR